MQLEVGDIVLCTVDRIVGTIVFVKIEGDGEGSIITSEIAPGRIRNLRDYVVPKKKIVCKVLRLKEDQAHLSLRRVTQKEKKEVLEQYKQEKSFKSILKTILKDKAETAIEKISQHGRLHDFFQEAKEDPKKLQKIFGKSDAEKILNIILAQKEKKAILKKEINFTSTKPNGLELIKKILGEIKNAEVKYISAGKYSIKTEAKDIKKADHKLKEIFEELEKSAKKHGVEFKVNEK